MYSNELTIEQVSKIIVKEYVGDLTPIEFIDGFLSIEIALSSYFDGWWHPEGVTLNETVWQGWTIKELITFFYYRVDELYMVKYDGIYYAFTHGTYPLYFYGLEEGYIENVYIDNVLGVSINHVASDFNKWEEFNTETIKAEVLRNGELLQVYKYDSSVGNGKGWAKIKVDDQVVYVYTCTSFKELGLTKCIVTS